MESPLFLQGIVRCRCVAFSSLSLSDSHFSSDAGVALSRVRQLYADYEREWEKFVVYLGFAFAPFPRGFPQQ